MTDVDAVFEFADRLSFRAQKLAELRHLRAQADEIRSTCGSCEKWMCSNCPREKSDMSGYSRGPSCSAPKCEMFVMSSGEAQFLKETEEKMTKILSELAQ